jgi:hypothetical protein
MGFEFRCQRWRNSEGFGADAYYPVPKPECASRSDLGRNSCVIDRASFFIRLAVLESHKHGMSMPAEVPAWRLWPRDGACRINQP